MAPFTVNTLVLIVMLLLNICQYCEMSIYAGLRRRPAALHDALQQKIEQQLEMPTDYLTQLMEENARRRLQQQFEQQLALINRQMLRQREQQRQRERYLQLQAMNERQNEEEQEVQEDYENNNSNNNNNNNVQYNDQYDDPNVDFSYKYSTNELNSSEDKERIPFAVGPSDPRFYEQENRDDAGPNLNSQDLDEYEEYIPAESKPSSYRVPTQANAIASNGNIAEPTNAAALAPAPVETSKLVDNSATPTFHRIKPQMTASVAVAAGVGDGVAPMKPVHNDADAVANTRHDISALIEKLQKQGTTEAILDSHHASVINHNANTVVRQHLGIEGEMGVYVVALIAGISAAITVGLIALGVAWYTLRNKTKAAADVEYPAYGVTGPNKDISPSGDRKLAQSAQMYHYQHQKQQIIAMENRQAVEGLSDVESDDDNEEGDYTVYECPGLAPTCEMEVKNPLFLDDTPVTPGAGAVASTSTATATSTTNNLAQATTSQSSATRKSSGKASTSMASSSDDKTKKNKK